MLKEILTLDFQTAIKNRTRFLSAICTLTFTITLFAYLNYFGDYSNTVEYFTLSEESNQLNNESSQRENRDNSFTTVISPERTCIIPKLLKDDPSLAHLMKHFGPLQCGTQKNWVYTKNGRFFIDDYVAKSIGSIKCDYYDIRRVDEYLYTETLYADFKNNSELLNEGAFRVVCRQKFPKPGRNSAYYTNFHAGVPFTISEYKKRLSVDDKRSTKFQPHVVIYLLDSMSRINFVRKLPKFYKTLTQTLDAQIMEGFNIVGDGTPWAVIPMTTGHFQTELPEARKRFSNSTYIDDWPFIFGDYKKQGYATSYVEEQPLYSAFSYKLKGFKKPPADHYLRTMLIAAEKRRKEHKPYCFGNTPKSLIWLKFWREMYDYYDSRNRPTFSFLFSSETSHDDYNLVQVMDEHLSDEFESMHKQKYDKNTFFVIMGDHGRRFGPIRQTQSGKLEEKLPFLALIVPEFFKTKYPIAYKNLKLNTDRLMTVFDLHATLINILNLDHQDYSPKFNSREISLFSQIPENRTCENAQIKTHFCSCLNWNDINDPHSDVIVQKSINLILEKFNSMISEANGLCAPLTLGKVLSAKTLAPSQELMAFKESQDYDNYFPDLTGNRNLSSLIYQVRFVVEPSGGDFEVSVNYFTELNKFVFSENDISRLNMYGDDPKCIINTHHHLRQYCFCVKSTGD